jgi:hypothetical protein
MRLNSARQAWHDAYYQPRQSAEAMAMEYARLGVQVQTTERDGRTPAAMHQALAGHIQRAIGTLPGYLQAFGHWLYNPQADDERRDAAQAAVYLLAYQQAGRMTAAKADKARYVAAGALYRFRRQHQGGQSECPDPLPTPESFRAWLEGEHGVRLASENWGRDWAPFVQLCFDVCDDLDRQALRPVAAAIGVMKEAA